VHGIVQLQIPLGSVGLRLAKTFAGYSYSLYVLHFPLLLIVRAVLLSSLRWQPDAMYLFLRSGIATGVCVFAFVVSRFTERKTWLVRSWLRNQISPLLRTMKCA